MEFVQLSNKFKLLWLAQFTSVMGTHISTFALGLVLYEKTESVTIFSLLLMIGILPEIAFSPIAGVYVDRWDKKITLVAGHAGAGVCSVIILVMIYLDQVTLACMIPIGISSIFNGLTYPSYTAATSQIVARENLTKVGAINQMGFALVLIGAPAISNFILVTSGLKNVYVVDCVSFTIAIMIIASISMPNTLPEREKKQVYRDILKDIKECVVFIQRDFILVGTLILMAIINVNIGMMEVLIAPFILSITDEAMVGWIMAIAGTGMLTGSLLIVRFSNLKRHEKKIVLFTLLQGIVLVTAFGKLTIVTMVIAAFMFMMFCGMGDSLSRALWQSKIPLEMQGRVFGFYGMVAGSAFVLGYVIAGQISTLMKLFMLNGGWIIDGIKNLTRISTHPEIAVSFIVIGIVNILSALIIGAYLYIARYRVDQMIPCSQKKEIT